MANFEKMELALPDFWACPLINADISGISEEEDKQINQFEADYIDWYCVDVLDDSGFITYHDATSYGVLSCDCSTFIFLRG